MEKSKSVKKDVSDNLPFSFVKVDIDERKIKLHWEKIREKIEGDLPKHTGEAGR